MRLQTSARLGLGLAAVALAIPASASGQAPRTWISATGDDGNPCSSTAPCRTLAGAITKTAVKGEINALDSGSFGGVTINKSITIDLKSVHGGVLASGTNGIVVNAAATDRVVLKGLRIAGAGTGLNGIRVLQARSVKIVDNDISGFTRNGVDIQNSTAQTKVVVRDSSIHDNAMNGVLAAPTGSNVARVTLRRNNLDDNGCGVVASRTGFSTGSPTVNCGVAGANSASIAINAFSNHISDSDRQALLVSGSTAAAHIEGSRITGSVSAPALQAINSGTILSYGNNFVIANPGGNGSPTGTTDPV